MQTSIFINQKTHTKPLDKRYKNLRTFTQIQMAFKASWVNYENEAAYLCVIKVRERCYAFDIVDPKLVLWIGDWDGWY